MSSSCRVHHEDPSADSKSSTANAGSHVGDDDEHFDSVLAAKEEDLTKEVQSLLETMNRCSMEGNVFERHMSEAQGRYKALLEQWSRLYEDLRAKHGTAIDRVRPYFDAQQVLRAASQRVQGVIREFSAAATQHSQAKRELRSIEEGLAYGAHKVTLDGGQQDGLSRATVWVLRCQQERDRSEAEYGRALKEFQEAQESLESWRAQIGDSTINRTLPCFKQLQQHQIQLAAEQKRINTCAEGARQAKAEYKRTMAELERINVAVHEVRREHASLRSAGGSASGASRNETPEATPEVGEADQDFKDCCTCEPTAESDASCACKTFGTSPRRAEHNILKMAAAAGLDIGTASKDDRPLFQ